MKKYNVVQSGLILKKNREDKKMSRKELANLVGKSTTFIGYLENNDKPMNEEYRNKFSEILDISENESSNMIFYESYIASPILMQNVFLEQQNYIEELEEKVEKLKSAERVLRLLENEGFVFKK